MKNILKILIPVIIVGAIAYQFRSKLFSIFLPCKEPIAYTLGTFDAKFNISQEYFLSALREAEQIWEKPFGRELFQYESIPKKNNNVVKVNLIYDYRQEATSKLAGLGIVVKENRASYDTLKTKFTGLKTELEKAKTNFDAEVANFNARQKVYEDKVKYWNSRGGAPRDEYNALETERIALEREVSDLKSLQKKINDMVEEINALVVVLNRLVTALNISVDKYNTVGASRGESFSEGVYSSDISGKEIDIYEFSNRTKLVRVLAHELGHALGLDHVEDPKAIMYSLNQGSNEILTAADLDALKDKCGVK